MAAEHFRADFAVGTPRAEHIARQKLWSPSENRDFDFLALLFLRFVELRCGASPSQSS
jgi:hypothetical protein